MDFRSSPVQFNLEVINSSALSIGFLMYDSDAIRDVIVPVNSTKIMKLINMYDPNRSKDTELLECADRGSFPHQNLE